jgi:head-tail adaptor
MLKESQCECGGDANKRWWSLTVQSPAAGQVDLTDDANWTTQGTIKAAFTSKGGSEYMQANQVEGVRSHVLETASTNFTRGILPNWRLVFGSRIIQITAAYDVDEGRMKVNIHGTERVS